MKRIKDDIRNNDIKRLYLLYGEETYLRLQYTDMLKNAVADNEMNLNIYEGRDINVKALIDQAETLPFFADRRLIVISNSEFFKSGGEELADYLKEAPLSTCFLISQSQVDKRSRLYRTCKDIGVIVEFPRQDEKTLKQWVAALLNKDGKKMTERDIEHFLELTGNDMVNIRNEVEKLCSYTGDRAIVTAKDADDITTKQLSNHVFDMVEALGNRNLDTALKLYYELLALKEAPFGILRLIVRQFNLLLQTKELIEQGSGKYDIAPKIGLSPYIADKYIVQSKKFSMIRLREALEECAQTEEDIKKGIIGDRMGLELLIVGLEGEKV